MRGAASGPLRASDDFPDPYIRVFDLSNGEVAKLRDDIAIPVEPFFGTMGVSPAGAKEQAVMPPGRFGGNMDTRQLVQGTTLYLPLEVAAAQDAVRAMIDHLAEEYELSREDAYVLPSLCVDLRISEVVDAGQYVVSALFALAVFTSQD